MAAEPFGPELAAAAAELDDPLAALDELLAADLVRATDMPRRFRFRHPIVRQAIYAAAGRRLAARRARAREAVLARQGAAAAQRAHHLEQCAEPGDADATDVLARGRGGGRAARPARRRATGGRRRCGCSRPTATARLALLVPRATALGAAGELAESRDALLRGARPDRGRGAQRPGRRVHRDDRAAARPPRPGARAADRDARGDQPDTASRPPRCGSSSPRSATSPPTGAGCAATPRTRWRRRARSTTRR